MAKRALCIGINDYPGTDNDLEGCVNDAKDWAEFLEKRDFEVQQLLNKKATKSAMKSGIESIVKNAKSGDVVVITYSGHGSWIPDLDGDEPDARDEVLCPYDIAKNGAFSDDEMYDIFTEREKGVRIIFVSDSCHSGTMIRLGPVPAGTHGPRIRFLPPAKFLSPKKMAVAAARATRRAAGKPRPFGGVLLAGCQDTEFSYDAEFNNRPNGAFTYFALKALKKMPAKATYQDWFKAIRKQLPNPNQPQTPNFLGTKSQKSWKIFE